jgi:hypothetical protein
MDIRIHSTADKDRLSQGVQVRYTTDMELAEKSAASGRHRGIAGTSAAVDNAVTMDAAAANVAATAMDAAATVAMAAEASPPAITVDDEIAAVAPPPVMASGATMVGAAGPGNSDGAKPNFHVADSEGAQTSQGH